MAHRPKPLFLRLLGIVLLATMLGASPVAAEHDDDHDDHGTSTAVSGHDDDDDDHDDHGGSATATAGADADRFGSYLHRGTCDAVGEKVEDIEGLGEDRDDSRDDDHARVWERIGQGEERPEPFWADDDDLDQALDALTGEEHVITVHETTDASSPVIACGAVTGEPDADGALQIDLEEVDDSGFEGRAYVIADDDDDDDDGEGTDVYIGVWEVQPAGV
jgi:hypothetical protein